MVLTSVLMSIGRRESARAFWMGFATASGAYLVFAHMADTEGYVPRQQGPEFTTRSLRLACKWLRPDLDDQMNLNAQSGGGFFAVAESEVDSRDRDDVFEIKLTHGSGLTLPESPPVVYAPASSDPAAFMRIGHASWALLLGWIAGHFTQLVYERSRRPP